ncbi:protein kinase domain-containing protein [Planctomicrobium sp. SH668]|uniref:serine/threonine protein kinase n=1 Tax=Planctomicrobium sp. SH668 TaxID=3448126 RepID=UPI003F5BC62C
MMSQVGVPVSAADVAKTILELRLVGPRDLQLAMNSLGSNASGQDLLQTLERQQLLTPFQSKKLETGDTSILVLGGCKLLYQNAAGSFARVYRACRVDNGQMIGVKVLRERWANDKDTIQLFMREGEIGKRLKHPNIVPIFEVGKTDKHHYIVMEFVEGGSLKDFLKIRGKLTAEESLRYTLHISLALDAAIAVGMTHRDMKTSNVLMSAHGVAKLIDFGLAADDINLNGSSNGDLAQALEYSTLEKNTASNKNDPRSDLFFLGGILYELLTGQPPYPRTKSREERKDFNRYRNIVPVEQIDPSLPLKVCQIVNKLLQVNPASRYQSARETAEAIIAVLKELGHPVPTLPGTSAIEADAKVILCVENRPNRQDLLREYFSKKGYRVLLLGDLDRALARLKTMTPTGIILFGDSLGNRIAEGYEQAMSLTAGQNVSVMMVLGDSQKEIASQISTKDPRGTILHQPVSLRDLRTTLEKDAKSN